MKYSKPPAMLNKRKKTGGWTILLSFLYFLLAVFLLLDVWVATNFFQVDISHRSMEDTFYDKDIVYANKSFHATYGDIIIIDVEPYKDRDNYVNDDDSVTGDYCIIKRLIAMSGDTVRCQEGVVSVKYAGDEEFTVLDEPYLTDPDLQDGKGHTLDFEEMQVGKGEIFFLGDHRKVSKDSRAVGCYLYTDIIGVVPDWSKEHKGKLSRFQMMGYLVKDGWNQFIDFIVDSFTV